MNGLKWKKKYVEMTNSFDIQDSDTISILILICKTYLKMNQAVDCGDLDGFQKLSRVYDTMRKSAKFTALQNKEDKNNCVDSVGQMVAFCEKEGGRIPKFEIKTDLDIVDKIVKDLKEYTRSLIYEDATLGRQIEDYIKKKTLSDEIKKEKQLAKDKGIEYEMDDEDVTKYKNTIQEMKEKDLVTLYSGEDDEEDES